jgi:predicted transcriptional regulator
MVEAVMDGRKRLMRATISLDRDDYAALGKLADRMDVSASWLTRQAIRDFLDRYGEHGQPELALRLADKRKN